MTEARTRMVNLQRWCIAGFGHRHWLEDHGAWETLSLETNMGRFARETERIPSADDVVAPGVLGGIDGSMMMALQGRVPRE